MTLITLSGIDGSGKTTLARSLVAELRSRGHGAVYYYGRFVPRMLSVLPVVFRRIRFRQLDLDRFPPDYAHNRQRLSGNALVRAAFRPLVYLAYTWRVVTALSRLLQQHETVVCDRYLLDTWVLDVRLGDERPAVRDLWGLRLLSRLLPSPDHSFFLDIPAKVAVERRPEGLPRPLLEEAIGDFRLGARCLNLESLSGTRTVKDNRAQVLAEQEPLRSEVNDLCEP